MHRWIELSAREECLVGYDNNQRSGGERVDRKAVEKQHGAAWRDRSANPRTINQAGGPAEADAALRLLGGREVELGEKATLLRCRVLALSGGSGSSSAPQRPLAYTPTNSASTCRSNS